MAVWAAPVATAAPAATERGRVRRLRVLVALRAMQTLVLACVGLALATVGWPTAAAAEEGEGTTEADVAGLGAEAVAKRAWERSRGGAHFFADGGFAMVYAPTVPIVYSGFRQSGPPVIVEDGIAAATFSGRLGINIGISQHVDVRVGGGAFVGGGVVGEGFGPFVLLPHANAAVSFGPGTLYRARVGAALGALVFQSEHDGVPPSPMLAVLGELAPLVLQFGEDQLAEVSLSQGLGTFVAFSENRSCAGDFCASGDVYSGVEGESAVFFGATTAVAVAVVVP